MRLIQLPEESNLLYGDNGKEVEEAIDKVARVVEDLVLDMINEKKGRGEGGELGDLEQEFDGALERVLEVARGEGRGLPKGAEMDDDVKEVGGVKRGVND